MIRSLGIDLGTTNTVAAVIEHGRPRIIKNVEGDNLTPSVVSLIKEGCSLIGIKAKKQSNLDSSNTIFSIKRKMGTDYKIYANGNVYTPQEISSLILKKVKSDLECDLIEAPQKAVITVPAYFNDKQRQATKEAGELAGFEILRIINEPTAAALAYGMDREDINSVLVWDLGGGTFDVSILDLSRGFLKVKSVCGNTELGGDDWDTRLFDYFAEKILNDYRFDIKSNFKLLCKLKNACERAKRELSYKSQSKIRLFLPNNGFKKYFRIEYTIDRQTFEDITSDLLKKIVDPTFQALTDARMSYEDIDKVILVGGSTRMPAIKRLARDIFKKKPYVSINPEEVVALGAAVQAGILQGEIREIVLVDVTPLSLGIETEGGLTAKIISRNSTIPVSAGQIFTTAEDNQLEMNMNIVQGEREMAIDNVSLGQLLFDDIPPMPRGMAQVEVFFEIDVNGIVKVTAKDILTGNEKEIKLLSAPHFISDAEMEQMVREAEEHLEGDKKKRELIELEIKADRIIQFVESDIIEKMDDLSKNDRLVIQRALSELKNTLNDKKGDNIRSRINYLSDVLARVLKSDYRLSSE